MSEFVHHHIVYDSKIGSHQTAAVVKKNIEKGGGQCCTPTYSKKMATIYGTASLFPAVNILWFGFPLAIILIPILLVLLGFSGYHARELKMAQPYMQEGSEAIICLGSDDSSATSSAPWAEDPGISKPWAEFIKACRRYEKLLQKVPEKDLVADQMFYGTVADMYALFEHTHHTSQSLSKHQMQLEFQTLKDAVEKFKLFIDRSSEIYAALRFNQSDQVMTLIETNLDHMNETALTKIDGLRELENPRRGMANTISLDAGEGDVQKKAGKIQVGTSSDRPISGRTIGLVGQTSHSLLQRTLELIDRAEEIGKLSTDKANAYKMALQDSIGGPQPIDLLNEIQSYAGEEIRW